MVGALLAVAMTAEPGGLQQAQALYEELKYAEAAKAVAQVRADRNLSHADLIQALWLEGLCAVSMNRPDDARLPWRELAFLEPDFSPQGDLPPKLLTPWYEARGWQASQKRLGFEAKADANAITFTLQADPLTLATGVLVHLKKGETVDDLEKGPPPLSVPLAGASAWWAELVSGNAEVLAQSGSADKPNLVAGAEVKVGKELPPPVDTPSEHRPRLVPALIGGLAVVSAAVAIGTGLASNDAKSTYDNAARASDGTITGITQKQAAALRSNHDTFAVTANLFIGLAIAAAAVAVIYFLAGPKETW